MNEQDPTAGHTANPYAPPEAPVAYRGAIPPGHDLGSRGSRLAARLIDGVILGVIVLVAMFSAPGGIVPQAPRLAVVIAALALLALALVNCILLHRHGQTLGKKLVGVRIVRSDRSRCSLLRIIFVRVLPLGVLGLIPLLGPVTALVDSLMIFGDDRRTLHDRIADTVVVAA